MESFDMAPLADASAVTAKQTKEDRWQRFQSFTMAHPLLLEVKEQLLNAIQSAAPGSLILVLGPTGVGKTTLRLKVEQLLTQELLSTLESDRSRIPFVSVNTMASLNGNFSWKDHFARLLRQMNEPLIAEKLDGERNIRGQFTSAPRAGFELQYAVEQALRYRRPSAVFLDEAQHLGRIASGRKLADQLDVIKSMANQTKIVHVLLGTYELLAFRNLSGQLSRRSLDIHFRRYRCEDASDLEIFRNVLLTFQGQLALPEPCDLSRCMDLFYERSIGCVGILKEWLMRALAAALAEGKPTLLKRHLEQTALLASQCERILIEAREGEVRLNEDDTSRSRLRSLLGIAESIANASGGQAPPLVPTRAKGHPGRRNPKRDKVGLPEPAYA
jgi:energy-coupling factor transporter ATP-binding protein EcfA2